MFVDVGVKIERVVPKFETGWLIGHNLMKLDEVLEVVCDWNKVLESLVPVIDRFAEMVCEGFP